MEFKDYQQRVLDAFEAFLDELVTQRAKAEKIRQANELESDPDLKRPIPDFSAKAWEVLRTATRLPAARQAIPFSERTDGTGAHVPSICFKIPTGGGKTLLAAAAISRIFGHYLSCNTGFVLWVVPNEAIYSQTKRLLTNRDHPYRQILDRASAGKVKFLEKDDRLDSRDVDTHLCVMLLMLQSAARETKETLRLFRDRGNVHGFFPNESDGAAHAALLKLVPNLDAYKEGFWPVIKDSLGNVLRIVRPLIIMDEGHRAYSETALGTLYGFNPSFLLEFSATPIDRPHNSPPRYANWLVDVRGKDLAEEEMIKLPINVKVKSGDDWSDCLREGLERLNELQAAADTLHANTSRYIRPILLVQVERTGRDQRDADFIHAEDAKEFLLRTGLTEREIAIKTSEVNDLAAPENQDLLSPTNTIRVIITKQALQEGWDCPFAYVLCSLAGSKNMTAMTQIIGRILRQPDAAKTGDSLLDECYVLCHHAQTRDVVRSIKEGLEADGMADLAPQIRETQGERSSGKKTRKIARRPSFQKLAIFLPVVNWVQGVIVRPLDYEQDILLGLNWSAVKMNGLADKIPTDGSHVVQTQLTRIFVADGAQGEFFPTTPTRRVKEENIFDPVYATRVIADIVPNPWIARELVGEFLHGLNARGFDAVTQGAMSSFLLEELRKFLMDERERLAESEFLANVAAERIQFRLRTDTHNWTVPREIETDLPPNAAQLPRPDGMLTEKSVFAPVYKDDFNKDEAEFACYLDEQKALQWWHRNVARTGHYHVQGWRKSKVYPDFIFALTNHDGRQKMVVMETKGDQLEGNLDTEYKRKLLKLLTDNYSFQNVSKAGELELVLDDQTIVECDLVLVSEWKTHIPKKYFTAATA